VAVGAGSGPAAIPEDREVNGSFHTTAAVAAGAGAGGGAAGGVSTAAAAVTNPLTKAAAPNTTAMAARSPPSSQRKPAVPLAPAGPSTTTGYDWSYSKEQFDLIRARVRFFFEVLGI